MQKSALLRNLNPRCRVDHQQAVQEEEQRKAMVAATQEVMTIQEGAVDKALRAVSWLAKEEVATAKFSSLLHFLQFLGVDYLRHLSMEDPTRAGVYLSYTSYHAFEDFQLALKAVVERGVLAKVKASPVVGVMTDESTDITVTRKMVVYVKVLDCASGRAQEH